MFSTRKTLIALSLLITFIIELKAQSLYINEIMASNSETSQDQAGNSSDWIEIYNGTNTAINLNNYYISDDTNEPDKFQIDTNLIVPATGRIILWASGEEDLAKNHLPFKLSKGGESVVLSNSSLMVIDTLSFTSQRTDVSFGRESDGSSNLRYFSPSSFNATNTPSNAYLGFLESPEYSTEGGFYNAPFNLTLSTDTTGIDIIYTTDGSIPSLADTSGASFLYKNHYPGPFLTGTFSSHLYTLPLSVYDKSTEANNASAKSSSYNFPSYIPSSPVRKGMVVSAIATKPNYLPSDIKTETYFFFPDTTYSFPVISISTNEDNLFDYNNGTYTAGIDFDYFTLGDIGVCTNGNYFRSGSQYERDATFEYFINGEKELGFPLRMRLHGGCSRSLPKKSLRLYANDKFDFPIFNKKPSIEPKRIILRNSGNDASGTIFRDALYQDIVGDLSFASQETTPSILFLNGEYWGIHNIRERFDRFFFEDKYDVNPDEIDLVKLSFSPEANEGDLVAYNALQNYLKYNSLYSTNNYNYIKTQLDIDSYIDYMSAAMYCGNFDWVTNNVRLWRTKTIQQDIEEGDGKWRFVLYDTDHGLGGFNGPSINTMDLATQAIPESLLFVRLLENPDFRVEFISRFADLMNTTFEANHCIAKTDEWRERYLPYIDEHIARWKSPNSKSTWENEILQVKDFFTQRPNLQRSHLRQKFGIISNIQVSLDIDSTNGGYIKVNSVDILESTVGVPEDPYPWQGTYFNNIPIALEAHAYPGYKFLHWEKDGVFHSSDSITNVTLTNNASFKAIFEENLVSSNPQPLAFNLGDCSYDFKEWSAQSNAGSYPNNMVFVYMDERDPTINATVEDFTTGLYNESSRTRINGLGEQGISFINTGNSAGNTGYPGTKLGGAILAINTLGYDSVALSFTAGTIEPNNREYNLRLQYRVGDIVPFQDVLDSLGNPIEYQRNASTNHVQEFKSIQLPQTLVNKPYVQLFWRYYYTGNRNNSSGGSRDMLRLDDISVRTEVKLQNSSYNTLSIHSFVKSKSTIITAADIHYKAFNYIKLLPGFNTEGSAVFKATIETCP